MAVTDGSAGGYATNTGRKTDDAQAAFKAGTVAMHLESTSVLRGYVDAAKGKFTVLTAPYPKVSSSSTGGPIIGGASLWIDGVGHSAKEKRAAWEFVKFAANPVAQAKWHTGTGYVPINSKPLDEQIDKDWMAKFPQFRIAVDQLHALPPSVASAGCLLGVMPQARKASEDGLEAAIVGSKPAEQAMKDAAASVQQPQTGVEVEHRAHRVHDEVERAGDLLERLRVARGVRGSGPRRGARSRPATAPDARRAV